MGIRGPGGLLIIISAVHGNNGLYGTELGDQGENATMKVMVKRDKRKLYKYKKKFVQSFSECQSEKKNVFLQK